MSGSAYASQSAAERDKEVPGRPLAVVRSGSSLVDTIGDTIYPHGSSKLIEPIGTASLQKALESILIEREN